MPALVIHLADGAQRTVELSRTPITLGRADSCDVRLPSEDVSREHAQVWLDEQGHVLVGDRHSKNGTRVDGGEPFRNAVRAARRSVRIGDYDIEIIGTTAFGGATTEVRFQPDQPVETGQRSFFPSSRHLDLNQHRLALLMSLTERIAGAFEKRQLLEQALDACHEALGFERSMIALKGPRGEAEPPVTRNVQRDETGTYTVSRSLINRALLDGERAVVNNPAVDLAGNLTESLVRFPICSALCVPILNRDEILGVIYGDRVTQTMVYTPADVDFLAAIARQVGVGLSNLRLFERHLDMQRVTAELRQARTIQRQLLPAEPLHVGRVLLTGYNEPCSAVGGDYFDYYRLPDGRIGLIIADVTGHGLPAALMMANFQAAVRVSLTAEIPLGALAQRLNLLMCTNTGASTFVTAILGRLDPSTGALEYVNAGHPGPLLLRSGRVETHADGHALPLGIEVGEAFPVQRIEPERGLDAALFYTDGLIEAANAAGKLLELDPVAQALAATPERTAETVVQTALGVVEKHLGGTRNADDLTLLAVQYAS